MIIPGPMFDDHLGAVPSELADHARPIQLPFPPTTNNLFVNVGKRRVRSKGYDAWLTEAAAMIWQQRPAKLAGPYQMTVTADRPDNRRRDLSNLIKSIEDLLVKCGIVADDSDARRIVLEWSDKAAAKPAFVHVLVEA